MDGCKNQYTTQGGRITIERTERLGRYTLVQTADCFPLGGDTLALGDFATLRRGWRVCDLGCGSGALSIRAALTWPEAQVTGIDYWGAAYGYGQAMCESHVNDAVRKAFPVKKVTSSRSRNETTVIAETELDEDALRTAISATGYEVGEIRKEPWEKKGLFGR